MQVYSFPENIQKPKYDFENFDLATHQERERLASAELQEWLNQQGYTGANTGAIYSIPHADGAALYMVAEGPVGSRQFHLIHLPYGDAWHSPLAVAVTKKDVLAQIAQDRAGPELPPFRRASR